jgi:hypothetical protein
VIYMLKVDLLIAAIVFGFAGLIILAMYAWTEARAYARALRAMRRIVTPRERFAISRMNSRNHSADPFRAA